MKAIRQLLTSHPTRTISLSFIMVIVIGWLLLACPLALNPNSEPTTLLNHLFVAVSATCVTGLSPIAVSHQYSLFGQIVLILMIQIGGLGFMSLFMMLLLTFSKKVNYSTMVLLKEAIGMDTMYQIKSFLSKIMKYTFCVECLGAVLLSVIFIPQFGLAKGIWFSIFHSISAFCNAGFDLLGDSSITQYATNSYILLTISFLIHAGGIGFAVALEVIEHIKIKKPISQLSLQAKLVFMWHFGIMLFTMLMLFIFERNNPETLGSVKGFNQFAMNLFQATTYRTAGFACFDQAALTEPSLLIGCFMMLIGGSPGGTAGGIKTMVIAVLFYNVINIIRGNDEITLFGRAIDPIVVRRAFSILSIDLAVVFSGLIILLAVEDYPFIHLAFEAFSAIATVGLSCSLTGLLKPISLFVIIVLMYIGRIGPTSLLLMLVRQQKRNINNELHYPRGDLSL